MNEAWTIFMGVCGAVLLLCFVAIVVALTVWTIHFVRGVMREEQS